MLEAPLEALPEKTLYKHSLKRLIYILMHLYVAVQNNTRAKSRIGLTSRRNVSGPFVALHTDVLRMPTVLTNRTFTSITASSSPYVTRNWRPLSYHSAARLGGFDSDTCAFGLLSAYAGRQTSASGTSWTRYASPEQRGGRPLSGTPFCFRLSFELRGRFSCQRSVSGLQKHQLRKNISTLFCFFTVL